jgi:hypothetical protein
MQGCCLPVHDDLSWKFNDVTELRGLWSTSRDSRHHTMSWKSSGCGFQLCSTSFAAYILALASNYVSMH